MLTFVSLLGLLFVLLAIFLPETIKVDMPVFQSDISFGLAEVPIGIRFLILCRSLHLGHVGQASSTCG